MVFILLRFKSLIGYIASLIQKLFGSQKSNHNKMERVRNIVWERVSTNQQEKRDSLLDLNRHFETFKSTNKKTKEDVIKLANGLKGKEVISKQLSELKEVFLEDKENITTFMEVDGALEALIKALSGQNSSLQIRAAYCLCNLSLGDKYLKIIKVAGPYLLVHLEGMNTYLIEVCAWTLGNLSSHHKKCVTLLKRQGSLSVLTRLSNHNDDNVRIAAAYALSHLIYTGYDVLTPADFQDLVDPVAKLFKDKHASAAYLMSMLSGNSNCQLKLLQEGIHIQSLNFLVSSLRENILNCAWYVRIIGNLVTETTGLSALQLLTHEVPLSPDEEKKNLFGALEYIMKSGQIFLIRECCWLLGNLMNHQNKDVLHTIMESGILEKVANPIRYLLITKGNSS